MRKWEGGKGSRRGVGVGLSLSGLLLVACASTDGRVEQRDPHVANGETAPYFVARAHEASYVGPGREEEPLADAKTVKIGWFGPSDANHPTAGMMWQAATMAIDDANGAGGVDGTPFELRATWSENPWGTGIKGVLRLVYEERIRALTGAPDGAAAHLLEQVAAKARLTVVNPVSTDKTVNLINVPWVFSCAPGDHVLAPRLARAIVARVGRQPIAIVSSTDHDARRFVKELLSSLHRLALSPGFHLNFLPSATDFAVILERIREDRPAAVAVIGGPLDSARFVGAVREAGLSMPVFGGPAMGQRAFVVRAGASAEGVTFPMLWNAASPNETTQAFRLRFLERFGTEPDHTAAYTYDAMNILFAAVRRAGLNRARIRDAVRDLSSHEGVTGAITWDPTGQNDRPAWLGTIRDGQIERVDAVPPRPARPGH